MTFLPVFKRHTNLWFFHQFSNDIQTYDFFTSFQTTYKPMTFLPVFKRHTNLWHFLPVFKRHTNLWLFYQFSNDIQTYDFFTSFQTTYKPMTFLPVFKRHTNLWLFYQFSNDIQTYDFFTSFQTGSIWASWRSRQRVSLVIWRSWVQPSHGHDFFTSFQTTYKPMTFLPVFKRHTNLWLFLPVFKRHTNLWLFYQFSDRQYLGLLAQ